MDRATYLFSKYGLFDSRFIIEKEKVLDVSHPDLLLSRRVTQHGDKNIVNAQRRFYNMFNDSDIRIVRKVLKWEGGYVNDPDDPGGQTIFGITRRSHKYLNMWKSVDAYDESSLKKSEVLDEIMNNHIDEIYSCYSLYLDSAKGCCKVDNCLQGVFAFLVNAGRGHSKNIINFVDEKSIKDYVISHYRNIILKNPRLEKFRRGWTNRIKDTFEDNKMII